MKIIVRWGAAAAVGALTALTLATPAAAHHNLPTVSTTPTGDCGHTTISAAWSQGDTHTTAAVLVVQVGGEQHTAQVGETIEVGPFETETTTVRYRVWGGGERDYDSPPLDSLDALVAHLDDGGGELDPDAPGVAWHELMVDGCPPASPSPTPTPTVSPSVGVSAPASTPASEPAPGAGGGGDELPVTGSSLPLLLVGGALLLGAAGAAVLFARRRRVSFTA